MCVDGLIRNTTTEECEGDSPVAATCMGHLITVHMTSKDRAMHAYFPYMYHFHGSLNIFPSLSSHIT